MDLGAWHDRENPALELKLKPYTDQNVVCTSAMCGAAPGGGESSNTRLLVRISVSVFA